MATILVTEDSPDARQLLRDLLERMGHRVIEAADGLEGVRVALTDRPDLIIMDLMMPNASGDTTLKFMRGTPELNGIPILVVSAHAEIASIARQHGADGWLAKPISVEELRKRVTAMLTKAKPKP